MDINVYRKKTARDWREREKERSSSQQQTNFRLLLNHYHLSVSMHCYHLCCNDINTKLTLFLIYTNMHSESWENNCWLSLTYLYYRVATTQRLHRPSAPFCLVVGPVVGLWLHLDLKVVRAGAGRKLPVKRWQRWAAITLHISTFTSI